MWLGYFPIAIFLLVIISSFTIVSSISSLGQKKKKKKLSWWIFSLLALLVQQSTFTPVISARHAHTTGDVVYHDGGIWSNKRCCIHWMMNRKYSMGHKSIKENTLAGWHQLFRAGYYNILRHGPHIFYHVSHSNFHVWWEYWCFFFNEVFAIIQPTSSFFFFVCVWVFLWN